MSGTVPVALIGGGGHAQSLCGSNPGALPAAYVDLRCNPALDIAYFGNDEAFLSQSDPFRWQVHIALVGIGAQALRKRRDIIDRYKGFTPATIIAGDASVAPASDIAPGCAVLRRAVVNGSAIGAHTVINTGAIVEHGCSIGSNCFIGSGAVICGDVTIGDDTFIGAGAIVRNGLSIPPATTIGMGAVVTGSITVPGTYVGNPARMIDECAHRQAPIVIAEAGVNHDGSLDIALQMVRAAAEAGADYVKFQTFKAANLVVPTAGKAKYQEENCGDSDTQLSMLQQLELTADDFATLSDECRRCGIGFMSTPFDIESVDTLAPLGMDYWKIPSGEITNLPLLRKVGSLAQSVILSTGMCNLNEVEAAVCALEKAGTPRSNIILLHCTTQYPTPAADVNLLAMETLRTLGCAAVGYSDHTQGIDIPVAATALGAAVIEKHFTLDRNRKGPDHKASLEPAELKAMVDAVRRVHESLGCASKKVTDSELPNKDVARKSIVAAEEIMPGAPFTASNLTAKRPGSGISPMRWDDLIGRTAHRRYLPDEPIDFSEL